MNLNCPDCHVELSFIQQDARWIARCLRCNFQRRLKEREVPLLSP